MMALLFQAALLDELNDVRELVLEVAPVAQPPPVVRRDRDTCHTKPPAGPRGMRPRMVFRHVRAYITG